MTDYLSASQLELFKRAPLDWALRYVEKIKTISGNAAMKGTYFHGWIRTIVTGYPAPDGDGMTDYEKWEVESQARALVSRMEDFFSLPWEFEVPFEMELVSGEPPFRGFIDLLRLEDVTYIYDIKKTTKTLGYKKKDGTVVEGVFYGLTKEDLVNNIQLAVYCMSQKALHGKIGHIQCICCKRFGKVVGLEHGFIEHDITPDYMERSTKMIGDITKNLGEFKKLYEEIGYLGIIERNASSEHKRELYQKKSFGQPNPFLAIYEGKQTIEEFKQGYKL